MSAQFASSGKPRWSVVAWVDHNNIFIEIPIKDKPPFISKYALTSAGLGEALGQMKRYHTIEAGPQKYDIPARLPSIASKYNDKTRATALAILRKHGIL